MKFPAAPPPSLSSIERVEAAETFDEKTQRFNACAEIFTDDGRAFDVEELSVRSAFVWEQIYLVDMELVERREQYLLPFQVTVRWEAMFGHTAVSEPHLCRLARCAIGAYLESHRTARGLSCGARLIRLQLP